MNSNAKLNNKINDWKTEVESFEKKYMKILFIGNTRLGDAILSTSILNYYSGSNLRLL